jgi:hypothetical protein
VLSPDLFAVLVRAEVGAVQGREDERRFDLRVHAIASEVGLVESAQVSAKRAQRLVEQALG